MSQATRKPKRNRRRVLLVLFFPAFALIWAVGWVMFCAPQRKAVKTKDLDPIALEAVLKESS